MILDKVHTLLLKFVDKFSVTELIELLTFYTDNETKDENVHFKIITTAVCKEFGVPFKDIIEGGNDKALYRKVCYYMHKKFDNTFSQSKMERLYKRGRLCVRSGIQYVEDVINNPRIDKDAFLKISKIEYKLNSIDKWHNQEELEHKAE